MNRIFSSVLLALAVSGVVCAEEEFEFKSAADWSQGGNIVFSKDGGTAKGRTSFISKKFFDVDPAKTCKLEIELKQTAGNPATQFVGVEAYDKNGKAISVASVTPFPKSESVLVKPVKKGGTSLFIKANSNWSKSAYLTIAWNTKPDCSDLPNHNIAYCSIKEIKTADGVTELVLNKPFVTDLAEGTSIRQHAAGGYMYCAGVGKADSGDFKKFSGKVKGQLKTGFSNHQWPVGAVKFRVIVLFNWDGKSDCVTQFKDAKLEIK